MNACLTEEQLLLHLDHEESASEHLDSCPPCRARFEQLRESLAEIDGLLTELSEMPQPAATAPVVIRKPKSLKRIGAGAALAACVLLSMFLSTRPSPLYRVDRFIPLDSRQDPIQLGTVVQVSVPASLFDPSLPGSRQVQAEVLLGDDGRPRAVRFLQ